MDVNIIPHAAFVSARRFPRGNAIVPPDAPPITYAQLAERMMAAAAAFIAAGVGKGDRIAIWAPNIAPWIVAALGAQAAGAILVPLNTRYKGAEAAYVLRASGARLLVTVSEFLGNRYPEMIAAEGVDGLDRIILLDEEGEDGWDSFVAGGRDASATALARLSDVRGTDVSDILFTSGTTGRPKGVVTTHEQNLAVYRNYSAELRWTHEDRLLAINPFFHSFGYKAGWVCSVLRGSALYPVAVFEPRAALDMIERERITLMPGAPTIFHSLLALPLEGRDLSSLRLAVTGATIVPAALVRDMQQRLGYRHVVTAYGLTETSGVVSMCGLDDDVETISGTSGRPIRGVEVKVVDQDGAEVPAGTPGDILVRGYNLLKGYYRNPEAMADAFTLDGWLRTGDIGILRTDGRLRITDRSKDVYICGGFNVYPAEVEQVLTMHPAVDEAAVIGVPDPRMGEVGRAFIVLGAVDRATAPDEQAIIDWSRQKMANYKAPRSVRFVNALPRNAAGKIEKFKLRESI